MILDSRFAIVDSRSSIVNRQLLLANWRRNPNPQSQFR